MVLSSTPYRIGALLPGLALCYLTAVAVTATDSRSTPGTLRGNPLQYITTEAEVEVCESESVALTFNLTIPANLTPDRLHFRTVWSPDKKNHCVIYGNISKCHSEDLDFILRAGISETWFPTGEHTRQGQLTLQLNNVSIGDAGYYEGELKTGYNINNVNTMLNVKEASACQTEPEEGGTATVQAKTGLGFEAGVRVGVGVGFGTCLGLVIVGGLIAYYIILKFRREDENSEKSPDVPV
ncbi:uncharacterized protein LOC144871438 isoform X2 [Branchiostoma floridae x Branchiostoma japonicum]